MSDYKTKAIDWQARPLPEPLSSQIDLLRSGKVTELDFSFTIRATVTDRCVLCHDRVANFRLHSGEEFAAKVETDEQGITFATLTRPHRCAEMERLEQFFLSLDDDRETGKDAE